VTDFDEYRKTLRVDTFTDGCGTFSIRMTDMRDGRVVGATGTKSDSKHDAEMWCAQALWKERTRTRELA
jgi:hypothetical protein